MCVCVCVVSHFEKSGYLSKVCSHQGWSYTQGDDGKWCLFLRETVFTSYRVFWALSCPKNGLLNSLSPNLWNGWSIGWGHLTTEAELPLLMLFDPG